MICCIKETLRHGVIMIGLGVALVVNVYMPGIDKQVQFYRDEIDRNVSVLLNEFSKYIKDGYGLWDGKELLALADLLERARDLGILEVENNMTRKQNSWSWKM
jgi:uncharacterized membrane protein YgaE (UPF0421/DUF939 family)